MSNPDSFIDEVKEEVRKDRLYRLFRRYGWLGALAVLIIVGATAYREWSATQERTAAENAGDAFVAATSAASTEEQIAELDSMEIQNADAGAIRDLMVASAMMENEQLDDALGRLDQIIGNSEVSVIYRDLAQLKSVSVRQNSDDPADVIAALDGMIDGNSEFRLLAMEIKANLLLDQGKNEDARTLLRSIVSASGAPADLLQRVTRSLSQLDPEA